MRGRETTLNVERLRSLLDYDPAAGKFYWRERAIREGKAGPDKCWNAKYAGKETGTTLRPDGYACIGIDDETYLTHRVAWFYVNGRWPIVEIDHINRIRNDNRIANLREVSGTQNQGNRKQHCANTSGHRGVYWNKREKKWRAQISINHKVTWLGSYDDKEMAIKVYRRAARVHFGKAFIRFE